MSIVVYMLLTPALYYLGARALVTKWLWSRYSKGFDAFMVCSACSGFWWGGLCAALGYWQKWSFLGIPGRSPLAFPVIALGSLVWTPLVSYLHLNAVAGTGVAQEETVTFDGNGGMTVERHRAETKTGEE